MASNSGVQQNFRGNNSPHHCKECGLYLNSAESLEVHLQYHKENLLNKWATQATSGHSEETNNNTKGVTVIKREFIANTISAAADSSDSLLKKSPDYVSGGGSRTTPEISNFGHASTPQSYHSSASPFQTPDNSAFSPSFQTYQVNIKQERTSPHYQQGYATYDNQYFSMENYSQDYPSVHHKLPPHSFRYHPYASYDRNNSSQSQVTSSSPAYPPQPTPSPSPKQCDKCGCVCESAAQLIEHLNVAHPPTPYQHQQNHQHFLFSEVVIKTEDNAQSEILDLDSHKVHHVFPEDEKSQNGDINGHHNPHSVSAMLSWPQSQRNNMQYLNGLQQMATVAPDFMPSPSNGVVTTSTQDTANYRSFEAPTSVITSTQVPNIPNTAAVSNQSSSGSKGTNWKSNEARRPKTYNCTACNKWFTSSGHLKRHYNTTLHKNAVKSSGQPDPAALPISAHHHPGRDSCSNRAGGETSPSDPLDDSREDERTAVLLQQPPNGPYDRQAPPNLSAMGHNSISNLSNGSPPNGEAGPSVASNLDTRGLLSIPTAPNSPFSTPGFNMSPMMHMDSSHFQMYPNASAPHVMQVMVTNNPSTTTGNMISVRQQSLPSFAQIQSHRGGLLISYGNGNVGGGGTATAPYAFYGDTFEAVDSRQIIYKQEAEKFLEADEIPYSPPNHNNNNQSEFQSYVEDDTHMILIKIEPTSPKAHIKHDYEECAGSPLISSTVQVKRPGLHKCFDCDKMFNRACYLTQHNKTFHSGDKPFKCTRCGKRFSCEMQFQEHTSKHAGDKPYKCDLCPKQFNHKTDLRRHMCLHTGQKPYACDTCGKGFIRKDHMLKHCETHARKPHVAKITAVR